MPSALRAARMGRVHGMARRGDAMSELRAGDDGSRGTAGLAAGVAAGALGVGALACLLVAPARMDEGRRRAWAALGRHRYAHRGLHDRALGIPENSLAAFRRARSLGFGCELDVHLTADGGLVVMHDSDLRRMCGQEGTIEDLSLAELGAMRLDGTEERIPTFDEVLEVFEPHEGEPPAPPLVVELKTLAPRPVEALCEAALAALNAHDVRFCVESFDPRVVAWLRRRRPGVLRGQLSQDFVRDPSPGMAPSVSLGATWLLADVAGRPDFVAYRFGDRRHPAVRLATGPLGGRLVVWTIRSAADLEQAEREGAVPIFEGFVPASPFVGGPVEGAGGR